MPSAERVEENKTEHNQDDLDDFGRVKRTQTYNLEVTTFEGEKLRN